MRNDGLFQLFQPVEDNLNLGSARRPRLGLIGRNDCDKFAIRSNVVVPWKKGGTERGQKSRLEWHRITEAYSGTGLNRKDEFLYRTCVVKQVRAVS